VLEPDVREMLLRGVLLVSLGLCGPAFGQPDTTTEGPTTYDAIFKPLLHSEARYAVLGPVGPFYPEVAITYTHAGASVRTGEAILECQIKGSGQLDRCKVLSSNPMPVFGVAAQRMAAMRRIIVSGGPPDGQRVRVRVPFDPATKAQVVP